MFEEIRTRFVDLVEEGSIASVEGRPFLPLLVLESEMQYGLALDDGELRWARVHADRRGREVLIFAEAASAVRFVELFEHDRRELEDRLVEAAGERGLHEDETLSSLPVEALVTGILRGRSALFCRRALKWLLPSELRGLRGVIAPLASDSSLPGDVRALAEHLTVPEQDPSPR